MKVKFLRFNLFSSKIKWEKSLQKTCRGYCFGGNEIEFQCKWNEKLFARWWATTRFSFIQRWLSGDLFHFFLIYCFASTQETVAICLLLSFVDAAPLKFTEITLPNFFTMLRWMKVTKIESSHMIFKIESSHMIIKIEPSMPMLHLDSCFFFFLSSLKMSCLRSEYFLNASLFNRLLPMRINKVNFNQLFHWIVCNFPF